MANGHTEVVNHINVEQASVQKIVTSINTDRLLVERMKNDRDGYNDTRIVTDMTTIVSNHARRNPDGCGVDPCPIEDWADQIEAD